MPDTTVLTKLRGTSAVTNIASGAIRGGQLDRNDSLPGVAVIREAKRPVNHSTGTDATKFADVAAECVSTDYTEAENLADAVEDALNGYTNTGSTPAVSMVHVQDVAYAPGPAVRGEDKMYERFVVNCLVQYSET